MKAKIVNGAVAAYPYGLSEIRTDNPNTMFPDDFAEWSDWGIVDVTPLSPPAGVVASESTPEFVGGQWVQSWQSRPYSSGELSALVAAKMGQIDTDFTAACNAIRAGYTQDEIQSWPQQQAQAEAYTADANASVPLLAAMATARGIPIAELAARILTNAAAYSQAYGQALGVKQARQDALAVPGLTAEQIEAI